MLREVVHSCAFVVVVISLPSHRLLERKKEKKKGKEGRGREKIRIICVA